jgi:choline kinase
MKAVILAAGMAKRLRPLTDSTPKCLLEIGNQTILGITLNNIISNNINEVIIVTGYLEGQIREFVQTRFPGVAATFIRNEHYDSTNNIYSLWLVRDALNHDDMLLMDSDIVFDGNIIAKLLGSGYENCLALKRHRVQDEEIKVIADTNGRVVEISKEVNPEEAAGESVGIEVFRGELLLELFNVIDRKIKLEKNVNQFYEAAFQEVIDKKNEIFIVDITDSFCMEIDTAEDLKAAGLQYIMAMGNQR